MINQFIPSPNLSDFWSVKLDFEIYWVFIYFIMLWEHFFLLFLFMNPKKTPEEQKVQTGDIPCKFTL